MFALVFILLVGSSHADAQDIKADVDAAYPQAETLYLDLHRHPELSGHEQQTAGKLASGLRALGYDVTTGVGRTGVVGVLRNGSGPVVLLRTELDALPVEEQTGLAYASTVRAKDDSGADVEVMHACGHDVHMAAWMTTARLMAQDRSRWSGTLVLMAQPAEETGSGARWMLADGLLTRFPRPDYALAIHDDARYPAGIIGYHSGPILANSDTVTVTIFGRGGHGARPETTIDPVVIAARTVLALQTIVSREISPLDSAVITVGAIHAGTRANIIPGEAKLEVSVRSLTDAVRTHLLSAIERVAKGEAAAAGAPRPPLVERTGGVSALTNEPGLTRRVADALVRDLGAEHVKDTPPEMVSEDFSELARAGVPTLMLRIGAVDPARFEAAMQSGEPVPSLHSALFAPDRERTIKTAVMAETLSLRQLMPANR